MPHGRQLLLWNMWAELGFAVLPEVGHSLFHIIPISGDALLAHFAV